MSDNMLSVDVLILFKLNSNVDCLRLKKIMIIKSAYNLKGIIQEFTRLLYKLFTGMHVLICHLSKVNSKSMILYFFHRLILHFNFNKNSEIIVELYCLSNAHSTCLFMFYQDI